MAIFVMFDEKSSSSGRKPRADAARNREHILEVALEVFAEKGDSATFDDVVKRSGLGVGTLYRHFPNREALFEAVYFSEIEKLGLAAEELSATLPPLEALRKWMLLFVDLLATKYSMRESFTALMNSKSYDMNASTEIIMGSMSRLADEAVKAGEIQIDFDPVDLLRALGGVANAGSEPNWQANARRMVDVLLQGVKVP